MTGALPLLLAAAVAQDPLVFSAGAELVRVEVLVLRDGRPVGGLSESDFEVRDDGARQVHQPVLEGELPVDATLVLDTSGSTAGAKLRALREAAESFLAGLREGERAALLDFRDEVRLLVPPTPDRGEIRRALGELAPRGSTALRDAVYAALRLRDAGARRSAVLVFSDGVDSRSWLEPPSVVDAAGRSDAVVYAVAVRGPSDPEDPFLELVAQATGGRLWTVRTGDDLRARFLEALADIRALRAQLRADQPPAGLARARRPAARRREGRGPGPAGLLARVSVSRLVSLVSPFGRTAAAEAPTHRRGCGRGSAEGRRSAGPARTVRSRLQLPKRCPRSASSVLDA